MEPVHIVLGNEAVRVMFNGKLKSDGRNTYSRRMFSRLQRCFDKYAVRLVIKALIWGIQYLRVSHVRHIHPLIAR